MWPLDIFFFLDLTLEKAHKFIDYKTSPYRELSSTLTKDSMTIKASVFVMPEEP